MTEIEESAELTGRTLDGLPGQWDVKSVQTITLPGTALVAQRVRDSHGAMLVYRSVHAANDDVGRLLLDNEIRALARLSRAFPLVSRPPFPTLVGYNMDTRDPWALVTDYQGEPAAEVVTGLLREDLEQFAANLFRAVAHTDLVEVVHGSLTMGSLYMTARSVQIVAFERAAFTGETRAGSPGPARHEEDLLAASKIVYEAFNGYPPPDDHPGLADVGGLDLASARPAVGDVPKLEDHDRLAAGGEAFDEAHHRKFPPKPRPVGVRPSPAPPERQRRSGWLTWLFAVGLVLVVAAVVLLIQTEGL